MHIECDRHAPLATVQRAVLEPIDAVREPRGEEHLLEGKASAVGRLRLGLGLPPIGLSATPEAHQQPRRGAHGAALDELLVVGAQRHHHGRRPRVREAQAPTGAPRRDAPRHAHLQGSRLWGWGRGGLLGLRRVGCWGQGASHGVGVGSGLGSGLGLQEWRARSRRPTTARWGARAALGCRPARARWPTREAPSSARAGVVGRTAALAPRAP